MLGFHHGRARLFDSSLSAGHALSIIGSRSLSSVDLPRLLASLLRWSGTKLGAVFAMHSGAGCDLRGQPRNKDLSDC